MKFANLLNLLRCVDRLHGNSDNKVSSEWDWKIKFNVYNKKYEATECPCDLAIDRLSINELHKDIKRHVHDQTLSVGQTFYLNRKKQKIVAIVTEVEGNVENQLERVCISRSTIITVEQYQQNQVFRPDIRSDDLEEEMRKWGIEGMQSIFKKLLDGMKIRALPDNFRKRLRIKPVTGVFLYGSSETNKVLVAQKFCQFILCKELKFIDCEELLMETRKGEKERFIRSLFVPPREDFIKYGYGSPLHVLIFDKFDKIARKRGEDRINKTDGIVSTLMSLIDGVERPENILIFAITDQMKLIDPALLRSGRIDRHIFVPHSAVGTTVQDLRIEIQQ